MHSFHSSATALSMLLSLLVRGQDTTLHTGAAFPSKADVFKIPWEYPFTLPKGSKLPPKVDLSPWFPPAGDQFKQASCSGWALGYGLATYNWNKLRGQPSDTAFLGDPANVFSPAFVYNLTILNEDINDCHEGVQLPDAIELVCDTGCATWLQYPVDTARHCLYPVPDSAFVGAYRHRMVHPISLGKTDWIQWKYYLARGEPIIVIVLINEIDFIRGYTTFGDKPWVWEEPEPAPNDTTAWNMRIGHIMVVTGYEDHTFKVLNSWGRNWGYHGYISVPESVMDWACQGVYVIQPGTAPLMLTKPAVVDDVELGRDDRIRGGLDEGEVHSADSIAFRVVGNGSEANERVIEILDSGTLERVRTVEVREGQPMTFEHEGDLYTFTWAGKQWFTGQLAYRLVKNDPGQHAAVQRFLDGLDLGSDGILDGKW